MRGADAAYDMSLTDNPGLCGTVPSCMVARLASLQGTAVIRPADPSNSEGGYCASAAPTCSPNQGCGCVPGSFYKANSQS